ncbi:MAG: Cro/CI family transcriptional regulator [Methylobacter sp.]
MKELETITNLQPALDHFGSGAAIARLFGKKPMMVTQWKRRGIPVNRAIELSKMSNGAFKPSDILPALKDLT